VSDGASDPPAQIDWARLAEALAAIGRGATMAAQAIAPAGLKNSHSLTPSLSLPCTDSQSSPVAPHAHKPVTLTYAIDEFLASKTRAARRPRYLRQLRVSLGSFAEGRANVIMDQLTYEDVETWLYSKKWKPRTMKGYLADVRTLFNFSYKRHFVFTTNAAAAVEIPAAPPDAKPPDVHTPDQVKKVLEALRHIDLDIMRHMAVRYFTGVRSAEAHRLRESDIIDGGKFLNIAPEKSKTRRRRVIEIRPNLAAWLALGGTLRPLGEMTVRKALRKARVPWHKNVTRHSFVSYHLALWKSAGETALEAGHSETVLFGHYRQVVQADSAREFWAIVPGPPAEGTSSAPSAKA
jgi:integrase